MTAPVELRTPRLVLRDFTVADWPAVLIWAGDPAVARPMRVTPFDARAARDYVERMVASQTARPRQRWEFAVVTGEGGVLVGACGLAARGACGTLGYALARAHWRSGYATEAAAALVDFGFRQVALTRVAASCMVGHVASARVLDKLGFLPRSRRWWERWWWPGLWDFELTPAAWAECSLRHPGGTASPPTWPTSNTSAPTSMAGSMPTRRR